MNSVSKSSRELYHSIRSEVVQIYYRRLLIKQLFTSTDTNDLLNRTAIRFFTTLKWDLIDAIVIALSRLTDPAKTFKKHDNASLEQFINSLDLTVHSKLIDSLKNIHSKIKAESARIENWRKKWVAHRALDVIQNLTPNPAISFIEVDKVLELLGKFLNEFERICEDPRKETNLFGKSQSEVEEIVENEQLKIGAPLNYEDIGFQDDGSTILKLIKKANS